VTAIFLVILLFKVSLTSGALYSFVFFAQMMSINEFEILDIFNNILKHALHFFLNVYNIFNLAMGNDHYPHFCVVHCANQKHHA